MQPMTVHLGSSARGREGSEQSRAPTARVSLIPPSPELPQRFPQFLKQKLGCGSGHAKKKKQKVENVSPLMWLYSVTRQKGHCSIAHLIGWPPGDHQQHACWNWPVTHPTSVISRDLPSSPSMASAFGTQVCSERLILGYLGQLQVGEKRKTKTKLKTLGEAN